MKQSEMYRKTADELERRDWATRVFLVWDDNSIDDIDDYLAEVERGEREDVDFSSVDVACCGWGAAFLAGVYADMLPEPFHEVVGFQLVDYNDAEGTTKEDVVARLREVADVLESRGE